MRIMVLNSGSSSIKFKMFHTETRTVLCTGLVERIGTGGSLFHYETLQGNRIDEERHIPNHETGISMAIQALTDPASGVIGRLKEIDAVGHRMIHGGEKITSSVVIDDEVERIVEELSSLAPLHNPPTLLGVRAAKKLLPGIPHVGVFDTAFHTTMPEQAYIYPLAYEYYEKHGIRRFGFHGTSHKYVSMRCAEIMGLPKNAVNCITCHLGNGVSITAVKNGKSVDTSLGFGTMCGVPMGTRAGDFDPDIVLYLLDELEMTTAEVKNLIYKNSGLKGLSGLSNDMRDIVKSANEGNGRARIALEVFAHMARKHIAALATNLKEGIHAVVFTAGMGENAWEARERICDGLEVIGLVLDKEKNKVRGQEAEISTSDSKIKIFAIPTNEELMIAMETETVLTGGGN